MVDHICGHDNVELSVQDGTKQIRLCPVDHMNRTSVVRYSLHCQVLSKELKYIRAIVGERHHRIAMLEGCEPDDAGAAAELKHSFSRHKVTVLEHIAAHYDADLPDTQAFLPLGEDDLLFE